MAETMSVEAVLQAVDQSFTATMEQAVQSLGEVVKATNNMASRATNANTATEASSHRLTGGFMQIASAMGAVAIAAKAFDAVRDAVGGAVNRFDTLQKYPTVMNALGYSAKDVAQSTSILDKGIKGLPTSLDSITSIAQQLGPLTGSATKASQSAVALNNAFLASGASAADSSRGLQQYTQMLSTGKVDMMSWRTLMETMPIALRKVANAFGYTGKSAEQDLYKALQSGQVTMDQLNDKFIELNGGMGGFADLAKKNSNGIATAFTNAKTAVVRGLADTIAAINKGLTDNGLPSIQQMIISAGNSISNIFAKLAKVIPPAIAAIAPFLKALQPIAPLLKGIALAFVGLGVIAMFSSKIAPAITVFSALGSAAKGVTSSLGGLLSKLNPFSSAGKTASEGLNATASGSERLGNSSPKAASGASSLAKNIALIGVGVGAAAAGMGLLVLAVTQLAQTGSAGAVAMAGVTVAVTALVAVFTVAGRILGSIGPQAAIAYAGMAILVTSFALLTVAVTAFASTGSQGLIALASMTASIIAITSVMAALSPVLTAGAVGMLAFGAAVLMVGAGIGMATAGIAALVTAFNNFNTSSQTIISTLSAIGQGLASMLTSFVTTLATQMPVIAQSIMQMLVQMLAAFAQFMPQMVQQGILLITNLLTGIAQGLPQLITAAVQVIVAFVEGIAQNVGQVISAALDLIQAFVDGIGSNISRIVDIAMDAVMQFVYGVGYALGAVLGSGAKLIQTFVAGVTNGLSASHGAGTQNANSVKSGISSVSLVGAGVDLIRGFVNGIKSMASSVMAAAQSIANAAASTIRSALKIHSPSRVMRDEVGVYIPAGIAVGMLNNIDAVTDAAGKLADAAVVSIPPIDNSQLSRSISAVQDKMQNMSANVDGTITTNNAAMTNVTARMWQSRMEQMMGMAVDKLDNVDQHPVVTLDTANQLAEHSNKVNADLYHSWR